MLWSKQKVYEIESFEKEKELEEAILDVQEALFGPHRIYLDTKKKIGPKNRKRNIPDGYLIDLTSVKEPKLFVVENELAKHESLRHIALQILEFSLAYETAPLRIKQVVRDALANDPAGWATCQEYVDKNGFENVDYLLERIVNKKKSFNALVIIDEMAEDLESVLMSKFQFPVEIITLQRFLSPDGDRLYQFEPFLHELSESQPAEDKQWTGIGYTLDPAEIDTIVVPARDEGFEETFIGENCWYKIRINSSMIPKIKWIAAYRVAPISAITHVAPVHSIEQYQETNKYILKFEEAASKIGPIKLVPNGLVKAPQASRYTSIERLRSATTLDEAF